MGIFDVLKDLKLLSENFDELLAGLTGNQDPNVELKQFIFGVPTTHTFGYEKMIFSDASKTATHSIYPYRKILFDDQALLSDYARSITDPLYSYLLRTMTKARDYDLDKFVFSYLGIHEYYYAKCNGSNMPAFGAFLSPSLDYEVANLPNATLYDLESGLIAGRKPETITMKTEDARLLTSYEVANNCDNNFFNYWVCNQYETKNYHDNEMWERKREFHYYDTVSVKDFVAVIWPYETYFSSSTGRFEYKGDTENEIRRFKKNYPAIEVYAYEWNEPEGLERFSFASFWIIEQLYLIGKLPTHELFKDTFSDKFLTDF